jgi:hypothetical protein
MERIEKIAGQNGSSTESIYHLIYTLQLAIYIQD